MNTSSGERPLTTAKGFPLQPPAAMVRPPHTPKTVTEDQTALPDIFDEVEEDLRAERARALGRRYAGLGIAVLVLILAGTGGYVAWQQNHTEAANALADRFITAATQADHATGHPGAPDAAAVAPAEQALSGIAASGPAGYRVLARLRLASLQWQTGHQPDAVATWQSVADDDDAPRLLRDLATLTSAQHQLDSGDPILLKQRLEVLTSQDNPWRPMAQQVIALLDIRTGHLHEAATLIQRITLDPTVPQDMRQMAGDLLTTLPPDALAPPKPPGTEEHQGATPASASHAAAADSAPPSTSPPHALPDATPPKAQPPGTMAPQSTAKTPAHG